MGKRKSMDELFEGRHFDREVIILCVRWYLRYKLSFRDLVEMMAERGLSLAHTTILRWVQRYAPEFVKRWNRFSHPAGQSRRVDETYEKICGPIFTGPSIDQARLLISGSVRGEMSLQPRLSSRRRSKARAVHRRPLPWTATRPPIARCAR